MRISKFFIALAALAATFAATAQTSFINNGAPKRFLDINAHVMLGGTTVTQNLVSVYPAISELDVTMGTAFGLGMTAEVAFTDFISLGVQANWLISNYRTNMAVADDAATSMTNCFTRNRYNVFNFPVYLSLKFNLARSIRWNVDGGLYYSFGAGGSSKTTLYSATINQLGQLISVVTDVNGGYYNSDEAFLITHKRGDIGLHLATGLLFSRRIHVGVSTQIGFKNVSKVYNSVVRPNVHNFNVFATAAYCF